MTNNDFSIPDDSRQNGPSSQLDIYDRAIENNVDDELLDNINLGLGNYSNSEHWQQVESFHQAMYCDTAFSRRLDERAIYETKREIAKKGWSFYDDRSEEVVQLQGWEELSDEERSEHDERDWIRKMANEHWSKIPERRRLDAVIELTGYSGLTPPQLRMMMMRHESSRSKGARLLDNLFGRVQEVKEETSEAVKGRLER